MKVFVAGATGAIGRPLISALARAGHQVVGMTTAEAGLQSLRDNGADGILANALDAESFTSRIKSFRPDAVIEELTSLPEQCTPEEMQKAALNDHRLRIEGGQNVYSAARTAGAKRYIVQSTGFFYAPGTGLATEAEPLASQATPGISASVQTCIRIEQRALGGFGPWGTALRYGFFYGPGTYHDPATGSLSQQVKEGRYPLIGTGRGVFSFVHVEDAAAATVAALDAKPGIYNVVDDDPLQMAAWLPAFAEWLGAPAPPRITEEAARRELGEDSVYYALRLRGAFNARARQQLGFAPRRLEWLTGTAADQTATRHTNP